MLTTEDVQVKDTRNSLKQAGFNEHFYQLMNRHGTDGPNAALRSKLQRIQTHIQSAAAGAINKRRPLIEQDVASMLATAKREYKQARKQRAEELRSQAFERASKANMPSTQEKLLQIEEAKMRFSAMGPEEAEQLALKTQKAHTSSFILSFRNAYEVDLLITKLRQSDNGELADAIAARAKTVPKGLFMDPNGAILLGEAEHYEKQNDLDTATLRDEKGRQYGVLIDQLVDLTPLEDVPA